MPRIYVDTIDTFRKISNGSIAVEDVAGIRTTLNRYTRGQLRSFLICDRIIKESGIITLYDLMVERGMILGCVDGPQELSNA